MCKSSLIEQWAAEYYPCPTLLASEGEPEMENVIYSSAKTLAGLVKQGEVSAVELVDGCLSRIEEVNGS